MKLFEIPMFMTALFGLSVVSGLEAPTAYASFAFGEPVNVGPTVNSEHFENLDCISSDGLEMYVDVYNRPGGYGDMDLWVLRRDSKDADWGPPENLGSVVNTAHEDSLASISADGLTLYFSSNRPLGNSNYDIYQTTRATKDDPWGPAVSLGSTVNGYSGTDGEPWISPDGLELYFESYRPGGFGKADIYVAKRVTVNDPWTQPVNLGPTVNGPQHEQLLSLSPDGLLLLFSDHPAANLASWAGTPRVGGYGGADMWMARRASLLAPWQSPVNLGPKVNGPSVEFGPRISPDGRTLYFGSDRSGGHGPEWGDIWQAPIIPIVDFTGDGNVDGKDLLVMVMQLGGDDPFCDIGPYAWGDGVVDAEDLAVLAEYIGEDVDDPTLVAHWAFDETEGSVASDSAGDHDGAVVGGATWQPESGVIGGAIQCNGVNGCVVTDTIPELGTGPFSVVAWVKGGAPGQTILSHGGMTDWLMANPIDGSLMTKLTSNGQPLAQGFSEAVITDGKWHRIALVWDGTERILYADGKEVARDPQPDITVSDGEFMIGASNRAGTLWSGLIDDVRIYSRVVRP